MTTSKHSDRFANAAIVRDCPAAINLGKGYCWNCGFPVEPMINDDKPQRPPKGAALSTLREYDKAMSRWSLANIARRESCNEPDCSARPHTLNTSHSFAAD